MKKRILVILGHPNRDSFCGAIANSYFEGAKASGNEVQLLSVGDLDFDPVLHMGYSSSQTLEADLAAGQAAITWAQHIVFVYPNWWGTMPAVLKGFIDRVLLPGFAFRYREGTPFWDRLLTGRSAHLIVTMDTPPWYYRLVFRMPGHNEMKRTILDFCGIKPVTITSLGPIKGSTKKKREAWLHQVKEYGHYL
jgi:putative NADPH-quinone reductase